MSAPTRSCCATAVLLLLVVPGPAAARQSAAEEAAALAVAHAALEAISAEDLVSLTDLMVDDAIIFSVSGAGDDASYSVRTRAEERDRRYTSDIVERGFDATVRVAGGLATVWLPYDLYIDGSWSHCGVDVFSLLRVEGAWRILTMGWTVEQPPACAEHPSGPPGR